MSALDFMIDWAIDFPDELDAGEPGETRKVGEAARVELDALRAERDEAAEKNQYLMNFIISLQWRGESNGWLACPSCNGLKKEGHKRDCELIRLAGVEKP